MNVRVFIIAEIGMNHDGSPGQAKAMITSAAKCGVDAVKFQTHIAEAETLIDAPTPGYFQDEPRYDYFKRTEFSKKQHKILKTYCETHGIEFLSSPFSIEAIELLEDIGVSTYKVPSGEVNNIPYLIRLAKTGKKILLSSGMSNWSELDEAVETLIKGGAGDVILMQCTSEYPCKPECSGLNVIKEMKERYNLPLGFSDHTLGIATAIAAVVMGAGIIEKHFTLSKECYGPDAKNSATPEEMKALVSGIRTVEKALSNKVDKNKKAEALRDMKLTFEKSIVASSDLSAGTVLTGNHLAYKKPGDGIPARKFIDLIGKKLVVDIRANEKFNWEMIRS